MNLKKRDPIDLQKKLKEVESEIIGWSKLLSTCKPDSTRLFQRIDSIEALIQIRRGLRKMLS